MARNKSSFNSAEGLFDFEPISSSAPVHPGSDIEQISLEKLIPYDNQPFRPYSPAKLKELAEDIKMNGILSPLIVRPLLGKYQILAGHNRANAAKIAGLETAPCIIKNVDDDTAKLILVNTNLNQRDELLPSEKAFAYKLQLEALKRQGKRTDLTSEPLDWKSNQTTSEPLDRKLESANIVGDMNNTSAIQIRRFIRLTYLIKPLLNMVDEAKLPFRVGVDLSYLTDSEQVLLHDYISKLKLSINLEQATLLRFHSKNNELGYASLDQVFNRNVKTTREKKSASVKLSYNKLSKYLSPETPEKEAVDYILKALEYYKQHQGS